MSIGKGGIGKTRLGDQRTPLGIYFVTEQLDTTRLHEKYGATAFPLDYPNAWDRRLGRTGYGIWVHGMDRRNGQRPRLDTDGCIALPNERLLALEDTFEPGVTPVIIGAELPWIDTAVLARTREALELAVARWAAALQEGDMFAWLALYDDDFRHWSMNKNEWSAFSLETVGNRDIAAVRISDLLLLADPVEEGLFLARFRLEVEERGGAAVTTLHRTYWRRSESGALTIIAEDSG
jgi:murein L,D-transpeptidase YafK